MSIDETKLRDQRKNMDKTTRLFDHAAAKAGRAASIALAKTPKKLLQSFIDAGKLDLTADEAKRVLARLEQMPPHRRNLYLRGRRGVPKAAIRAFCYECLGWGDHPEVCTSPECVLFGLRPRRR